MQSGQNGDNRENREQLDGGNERRRDVRAYASPPVEIIRIGETEQVEALNVSYRGLFLRMQSAPQQNELLKMKVTIPGKTIVLNVVVVRSIVDVHGRHGVGVRFFALGGEEKRHWEAYITSLIAPNRRVAA